VGDLFSEGSREECGGDAEESVCGELSNERVRISCCCEQWWHTTLGGCSLPANPADRGHRGCALYVILRVEGGGKERQGLRSKVLQRKSRQRRSVWFICLVHELDDHREGWKGVGPQYGEALDARVVLGAVWDGEDFGVYVFTFEAGQVLSPFGRVVGHPAKQDWDCIRADRLDRVASLVIVRVYAVGDVFTYPEGKRFAVIFGFGSAKAKQNETRARNKQEEQKSYRLWGRSHGLSLSGTWL
jgi:hypothetical protein